MAAITSQECYSDDWRRTNPDFAVYLPTEPSYHPEAADHFLVDYTPGGDLLAILTICTRQDGVDYRVIYTRSNDGGVNWSAPALIDGLGPRPAMSALSASP